jgi:GTP-binding protein
VLKVALIGKPNVGKSSLFNKISRSFDAIISDVSGTTRDVKRKVVDFDGQKFVLIDTGGIEDRDEIFDNVKVKSLEAAKEADIVLFMVDGQNGFDEDERKLFFQINKLNKNTALIINKVDNDKIELYQFDSFGANIVFDISIAHSRKLSELVEWILSFVDYTIDDETINDDIKVAIIGRVNVGKSSLLNTLTHTNRSVVSSIAGTTIDPVDETIEYNDKKITFIDTAGIRKRSKIVGIERWALDRSKKVLEKADVALLVLDSSEDFIELDERVAGLIDEHKTAAIIVLNKWDIRKGDYEEYIKAVRARFRFLYFVPIVSVSAQSGQRVNKILDMILEVYQRYSQKIPTRQLNEVIKTASTKHYLPSVKGKFAKIVYAVQYKTKPITISLVMNYPEALHFSYSRYLINVLRENFELEGVPVVIHAKKRGERDNDFDTDRD